MLLARLLCLQAMSQFAAAQVYPTTVEFDAVFPRNDTYAPVVLMPLVFSFQNPQSSLITGITFTVFDAENTNITFYERFIDLRYTNYSTNPFFPGSTSDPYYVFEISTLLNKEGRYFLTWSLVTRNCSTPQGWPYAQASGRWWSGNETRVYFTIKKGAQQPSIVSPPNQCPAYGLAFNVTGIVGISPELSDGRTTCAVLGEPPAPNPCAIKVDNVLDSKISASMTASACDWVRSTTISGCPSPTKSGCDLPVRASGGTLGLVVFLCLASFFVARTHF